MNEGIDFPANTAQRAAQTLAVEQFDSGAERWIETPPEIRDHRAAALTLVTFNTWFQGPDPELRHEGLLACLRDCDAHVILLQEATTQVLDRLQSADWIRARYCCVRAPFRADAIPSHGLMMLTRIPPARVMLHPLPTHMGRWSLIADLNVNGAALKIATVHLESMKPYGDVRGEQLKTVFGLLADAPHAVLAGDFNFCSSWTEENGRIDPRFTDLWPALRPDEPGYTQDTEINLMLAAAKRERKQVRFDRMLLRSDSGPSQWVPGRIELLGTVPVNPRHPRVFPSDHFGLCTTITHQASTVSAPGASQRPS